MAKDNSNNNQQGGQTQQQSHQSQKPERPIRDTTTYIQRGNDPKEIVRK